MVTNLITRHFRLSILIMAISFFICPVIFAVETDDYRDIEVAIDKANFDQAIKLLTPLSNSGVPKAQQLLGNIYLRSLNPEYPYYDYRKGMQLLRKAALQAYAPSLHAIGIQLLVRSGSFREVNIGRLQSQHWFSQAANKGYAKAQLQLGLLYEEGIGVEANNPKAYKWLLIALNNFENSKNKQQFKLDIEIATGLINKYKTGAKLSAEEMHIAEKSAKLFLQQDQSKK